MRAARFETGFGTLLIQYLAEAHMTQRDLARAMSVSPARINRIICAHVSATQVWVNKVSNVLSLSEEKRVRLHAEAARLGEAKSLID